MQELESTAESLFHILRNTLPDHDWDNEEPLPFVPLRAADFQQIWWHIDDTTQLRTVRPWPNVRRLYAMLAGITVNNRAYFDRQLRNLQGWIPEANARAGQLILEVQRKGTRHNWIEDNDLWRMPPHEDETRDIGLENVQGAGTWVVSTSPFYCSAMLTMPA